MSVDPTYFKPVLDWVAAYRDRFLVWEKYIPDVVVHRWRGIPSEEEFRTHARGSLIVPAHVPHAVKLILAAAYLMPSGRSIDALVHTYMLHNDLVSQPGWENTLTVISGTIKFPELKGQHSWSLEKDMGVSRILKAAIFFMQTRYPAPVIPRTAT